MFNKIYYSQRHAFHLVDPSIMPLLTSLAALTTTIGGVMYFHGYLWGFQVQTFGILGIIFCMFLWWRDVVREGTLEGRHTNIVQLGLRYGMLLFIASEVMFFFAFFWAFFAAIRLVECPYEIAFLVVSLICSAVSFKRIEYVDSCMRTLHLLKYVKIFSQL